MSHFGLRIAGAKVSWAHVLQQGNEMILLKFNALAVGPGPSEKIVEIDTSDGKEEVVLHSSSIVHQDKFEVGMIGIENDRALIELPRESSTGRWRVWVPRAALIGV